MTVSLWETEDKLVLGAAYSLGYLNVQMLHRVRGQVFYKHHPWKYHFHWKHWPKRVRQRYTLYFPELHMNARLVAVAELHPASRDQNRGRLEAAVPATSCAQSELQIASRRKRSPLPLNAYHPNKMKAHISLAWNIMILKIRFKNLSFLPLLHSKGLILHHRD